MSAVADLVAANLSVRRGSRIVLADVSLQLVAGDLVAMLGVNGAGKTTLLRLLLGLLAPDAGTVQLAGQPLRSYSQRAIARRIAYVPQHHTPSFPYTVRDIVAMGRTPVAGIGARLSANDMAAVTASLERLALVPLIDRVYSELSGGERQAVLIARALAQGARILLMDEPTASLDLGQQTRLMLLLQSLTAEGYAILVSVHQPELALRWCNRALILHHGQVLRAGTPDAVLTSDLLSIVYGVTAAVVQVHGRSIVSVEDIAAKR